MLLFDISEGGKVMKNWLIEYSRYAFTKAKRWSAGVFSVVGFVGTFIGLIFSFNLLEVEENAQISIAQSLYYFVLILIVLFVVCLFLAYIKVGVISALLKYNPNNENYRRQMAEIDELRFRGLYVDKQIYEIQNAKKSVLVSIHSLSDENKKKQYKRFNEALATAQERGVDVKVLAPCGIERSIGAYQLSEHYHIEMRFANQLEVEDLRFLLVDDERAVFSQQNTPNIGLSAKFSEVHSRELGKTLRKYYEDVWNDEYTLNYSQFLIKSIREIFRSDENINFEVAAKRLNVPKVVLERTFKSKCE